MSFPVISVFGNLKEQVAAKFHYMIFTLNKYSGPKINQGELQGNQAAYIKQN